eukprot:1160559-Pelagomonas_calceolata.AAC.4
MDINVDDPHNLVLYEAGGEMRRAEWPCAHLHGHSMLIVQATPHLSTSPSPSAFMGALQIGLDVAVRPSQWHTHFAMKCSAMCPAGAEGMGDLKLEVQALTIV